MKNNVKIVETGQSIVLVALLFLGLIAMLALVLDGGNLFTQRRIAQVAADAGALAGAREFCFNEAPSISQRRTAAISAAQNYAINQNGAETANVIVDSTSGDVSVDASITFDTFFLGVLGRPQLTAVASATAGCDPASEAYVLPVAWSCRPWVEEEDDDEDGEHPSECAIRFSHEADGDPNCVPGDFMYLIVDSNDIEGEVICLQPSGEPPPDPPEGTVNYVDCDTNDDGVNDLEPLSGGNRSWLDLDGGGGGAADLMDWIENGIDDPIYPHWWFPGQTGVAVSVYNAVHDHVLNDPVVIPVFDSICPDGNPQENCPAQWHDGVDNIMGDGGASTDYFHVISFSIFEVTCVDAGSHGGCYAHGEAGLANNVKTIEGCFIDGLDPDLGAGGGIVDTGADVVYLKR
jgi:hypothetical protein